MKYKHVFAIPAYGDSPYLERCIRSLRAQTVASRIILCTSTPSAYINALAAKYARTCVNTDLVTIAHQDDMYHKKYVEYLLEADSRYPDMTVYTTDYVIVKGGRLLKGDKVLWVKRLLRLPLRFRGLSGKRWIKRLPLMFGNSICCPATTYNKKLLGEPLVRSEFSFALDWDMLTQLAEREGRFICTERPLLFYRVHDGAETKKSMEDDRRAKEERAMFLKFWPRPVVNLLMRGYQKAYDEYE